MPLHTQSDLQRDFLTDPAKIADLKRSRISLKVLKRNPDEINYTSQNLFFAKPKSFSLFRKFKKYFFRDEKFTQEILSKINFFGKKRSFFKNRRFHVFFAFAKKVDFTKDFLSKNFRLGKIFFENRKSENTFWVSLVGKKIIMRDVINFIRIPFQDFERHPRSLQICNLSWIR